MKALVELHEGWITLESEPNEGASFKIHLPKQSTAAKTVTEPKVKAAAGDDTVASVA